MEDVQDGRFSFPIIYNYARYGKYPSGYTKTEKQALRKRSKYFVVEESELYYIGGGKYKTHSYLNQVCIRACNGKIYLVATLIHIIVFVVFYSIRLSLWKL